MSNACNCLPTATRSMCSIGSTSAGQARPRQRVEPGRLVEVVGVLHVAGAQAALQVQRRVGACQAHTRGRAYPDFAEIVLPAYFSTLNEDDGSKHMRPVGADTSEPARANQQQHHYQRLNYQYVQATFNMLAACWQLQAVPVCSKHAQLSARLSEMQPCEQGCAPMSMAVAAQPPEGRAGPAAYLPQAPRVLKPVFSCIVLSKQCRRVLGVLHLFFSTSCLREAFGP